jgi:hypothetical protein
MTDQHNNNPTPRDRDGTRRRAENHFVAAERRDALVKRELEAERAASDAKTAKLKALRLAKEEAERLAAQGAADAASAKPRAKRKTVRIWV